MADADFDLVRALGQFPNMSANTFTLMQEVDFSEYNVGAGESADVVVTPAEPCALTDVAVLLLTAEGGTLTIDVGDESDPDGWVDGGNANGTPNAFIAKAGTEAYSGPKYYAAGTPLRVTCVNAADAAKIMIVAAGFTLGRP